MRPQQSSVRGIVGLLVVAVLTACGVLRSEVPTPIAEAPSPAPIVAPAVPPPANMLRWSIEGVADLTSIDPATPGDAAAITVINLVFGGLIRLDEQIEVQPDGAERWEVSADGTTYTFTIRAGLTFADGTPVTAGDFVYAINRALSPAIAAFGAPARLGAIVGARDVLAGKAQTASGIRAVDARTLEIRLERPLAYFLAQLSYPYTFVVPRQLVESGADWERRAYGTGPFTVTEWRRGQSILLSANPRYWQGTPGVAQVLVLFHQESEAAYQLYRAGGLDIMGSQQNPLPAVRVAEVRQLPDFKSTTSLATRYVGFNNTLAPFDNVDVRRALAQAVDKRALAGQVLAGEVIPADRILPDGMLGTQLPIKPLAFDPAAARAALAQAGFPDGAGLPPITLAYGQEGDNALVAQALQRMWEQHLGIRIRLQPFALSEFSRQLDITFYTPSTGLQCYLSIWGADYPDPQNFLSQQLRTGMEHNNGHFSNPTFDRLVDEADQLSDRAQIERRLQLYNQAEQIAVDNVGWLPLYYPKFNILVHPRVEGLVVTPNGLVAPDWSRVRVK